MRENRKVLRSLSWNVLAARFWDNKTWLNRWWCFKMFESPEIYKRSLEWFRKLTVNKIMTLHAASGKFIFTQGATFQNKVDTWQKWSYTLEPMRYSRCLIVKYINFMCLTRRKFPKKELCYDFHSAVKYDKAAMC